MFEKVKDLIQVTLNKERFPITMDTDLVGETGINSLELVELACAFEDEFNISVPDNDIHKFRFIGDIIKYLEEKNIKPA